MARTEHIEIQLGQAANGSDGLLHVCSESLGRKAQSVATVVDGVTTDQQPLRWEVQGNRSRRVARHVDDRCAIQHVEAVAVPDGHIHGRSVEARHGRHQAEE